MKNRLLLLILAGSMMITLFVIPSPYFNNVMATEQIATNTDATPGSPDFKKTGWYQKLDGSWRYFVEGVDQNKPEGFWYINEQYLYLDIDGKVLDMEPGWYKIEDKYLYISQGQALSMPENWYKIQEKYLYINVDGTCVNKPEGWYRIQDKYLYIKVDGSYVKKSAGWYMINNLWVNLKADGTRVSKKRGWYAISGLWTYIGAQGGHYQSVWRTVDGKKYYFNKNGQFKSGVFKIGTSMYFQNQSHGLYKNAVLKTPTTGNWYYYGPDGKRKDNGLTKLLVKVYRSTVKTGMTTNQKLKAMYMYLATYNKYNKNVSYQRIYGDEKYIGKSGWIYNYAYYLLSKKKGNCYRFACAFGYMAKMLGYNSYVLVGNVPVSGVLSPHGIVQININGKAYYYDPELQFARKNGNRFQQSYYPIFRKGKYYKVNW